MKRFTTILITVFLTVTTAFGQTTNGTVCGRVVDAAGAIVVGAEATAGGSNGVEQKTQTNRAGEFSFNLAPGKYTIRVASSGFAVYENAEVNVVAKRSVTLDVALNVAQAEAEVTIGEEEPVNTDPNANASAVVLKERDIEALPDNDADLEAALRALAGPGAGPNGRGHSRRRGPGAAVRSHRGHRRGLAAER